MRLVLRQAQLDLSLCLSPSNMLLMSHTSKPRDTTPADGKMLETICIAHAAAAMKAGKELLEKYPAPEPSQQRRAGPWRVVCTGPRSSQAGSTRQPGRDGDRNVC
jgi:hypothetical protein